MTTTSPVAGIDHVGMLVRDIDASLLYFRDVLGMQVVADDANEQAAARLVYLDAGNMILQLVSPYGPGAIADALETEGEGLHHVCFQVESIPAALEQLAPGKDVPITKGGRNRRTCFLPDRASGLVIELTEIDEISEG